MLATIRLEVSDPGYHHCRHTAAGQEKHTHQGEIPHPLKRIRRDRFQE
jgi:hypothetical protein